MITFYEWLNLLNELQTEKILYIMRGVPGSGKSTEAFRLAGGDESKIFSVDDYFGRGAEYKIPEKIIYLRDARKWNYARVQEAAKQGITPIIADETHLKASLAKPYSEIAKLYGYKTDIREPQSDWWQQISPLLQDKETNDATLKQWSTTLGQKNLHGVKPESIYKMFQDYKPYSVNDLT